jgi:hypothetical protein
MLADNAFMFGYQKMFYVLAGLASAYAYLGRRPGKTATLKAGGSVPQSRM